MNNIALQLALVGSGSVGAGENVVFDTALFSAGGISYNNITGVITLSEIGRYAFDWWVATQSSTSTNGAVFAVSVSEGAKIVGNSPLKTGQVGGFAVIQVSTAPASVSLTNESTAAYSYASAVPVKASLFVRSGLENLMDGNTFGALRGIGTASNYTMGTFAVALGVSSTASGYASYAEGDRTVASGDTSHAEGVSTTASGPYSHAQGSATTASGDGSHAQGISTIASGPMSHAEGFTTIASGDASHAQGISTRAPGPYAHAEGYAATASGDGSHAEGYTTTASGHISHAEGNFTSTNGYLGAHIMGKFGNADMDYSWFLANGSNAQNMGLSAKILSNGEGHADQWIAGGADYAELFETMDGNPIEPGYFVTFGPGRKIRKATESDIYILGVSAIASGYVGDAGELRWKNKYLTDEWGRVQYQEVEVPETYMEGKKVLMPAHTQTQPILNPSWDPTQEYVPRAKRPEWVCVGLLGKLLLRDDGTCIPGGYCMPNEQGAATSAVSGYRVLERTGENQIQIMLK